jgi:hypothetical protein
MKQRLLRILSVLCILALACGCLTLSAFAEDTKVTKVITVLWEDEDDYEGLRPDSVTMSIGGETVVLKPDSWIGEATVSPGATWSVADLSGSGYIASAPSGTDVTVVRYTHLVPTINARAYIVWEDNNNAAGLRPNFVRINLFADGEICRTPATVSSSAGSGSWENLYVNQKGTTTPIVYSIAPADEITGYTASVSGGTVTYTLKTGTLAVKADFSGVPEGADLSSLSMTLSGPDPQLPRTLYYADLAAGVSLTVIPGAYVLEDNNGSDRIPGYVFDPERSATGDGTQVTTGGIGTLTAHYAWKEEEAMEYEDVDPTANLGSLEFEILGPEDFTPVTIRYSQFTNGRYVLDNLVPGTYAVVERNADGLVKNYSLQSESITGITVVVGKDGKTAVLFNKYAPVATPEPEDEYVDVPVIKIWNDDQDHDGNRPASVIVRLYANGVEVDSHVLTGAEGWQFTFTELDRYDENQEEIVYTLSEDPVEWYTSEVNGSFITNTYNPETTSVAVAKLWDDDDDARGIRPSSIAVTLLPIGEIYLLTAENGWSLTVDDLPTRLNGEAVEYSWSEQEIVGYKLTGAAWSGNGLVFTNYAQQVPKIPEDKAQPKTVGDLWFIFEEYETALGGEILINHVGDCFD